MDIIRIGHIRSYLAHNVLPDLHSFVLVVDIIFIGHILHSFVLVVDIICIDNILHSFFLVVDIICIGHITSYLDRNVHPIFHIYSSSVIDCFTSIELFH